jgi:hypothetical protein
MNEFEIVDGKIIKKGRDIEVTKEYLVASKANAVSRKARVEAQLQNIISEIAGLTTLIESLDEENE